MEKERQLVHYNLLKILAIFMVVAVHMMQEVELVPLGNEGAFRLHEVVRTVLLTSNGLFFMVSGRFLLERYDGKMGRFYWKRLVKIGIPVFGASLFYYTYVYGRNGMNPQFWKGFARDFLQSRIQGYFWFVYALAGFYLAVPFLARMFSSMGKGEKKALIGISLAYFFVQNLYQIFGLEMVLTAYPFYSWIFYCVWGYLLDSLELSPGKKKLAILAGAGAFVVSSWETCFWGRENPALHNYSVTMILMTGGIYLAVTSFGKAAAERFSKGIQFVAKRSFYLYLMHGITQFMLSARLKGRAGIPLQGANMPLGEMGIWARWVWWLGLSAVSFVLALSVGCVLEAAYRPVAGRLLGAGRRKRG